MRLQEVWQVLQTLKGSLRLRLGLLFGVSLCVLLFALGALLASLFQSYVHNSFKQTLQIQLEQVLNQIVVDENGAIEMQTLEKLNDPRWTKPYGGLYWQIESMPTPGKTHTPSTYQSQQMLLRSRSLWDFSLSSPTLATQSTDSNQTLQWLHLLGPDKQPLLAALQTVVLDEQYYFRVWVAQDQTPAMASIDAYSIKLSYYLGALLLLLLAITVLQIMVGLSFLWRLQAALTQLKSGKTLILEGQFPKEIQPLVDDFNSALQNSRQQVERARTHAGNLAHALKTPLSLISLSAQNFTDKKEAQSILQQISAATRAVNWHLAKARFEQQYFTDTTAIFPCLQSVLAAIQKLNPERKLQSTLPSFASKNSTTYIVKGANQDLQEIFGNLLENAMQWAKSQVWFSVEVQPETLSFHIEDDGKGIDFKQLPNILQRGSRLDEKSHGNGLGLAIAQELLTLCQGTLTITSSSHGGLKVSVVLPYELIHSSN